MIFLNYLSLNNTYQQNDSIIKQKIDSAPKVNTLQLLTIEDESALIIPDKKVKTHNAISNNITQQDTLQKTIDTSLYNKGFEYIPTRKVTTTTSKEVNTKETLLFNPEVNNKINTTWQTILLLLAFGLLGFVKAFSSNRFNQIIKSLFSFHAAEEVAREEKVFFHRVNLSLFFLYVISVLLLIISISIFNLNLVINEGFYIKLFFIITAVYIVKFIGSFMLSAIFSRTDLSTIYTYNILIYNYLYGVVLLPCLALIYFSSISFSSIFTYAILPSFILIFLLRIYRLFIIGKQNNFFVLYIILYICTLEILPLVVLSKFFIFK